MPNITILVSKKMEKIADALDVSLDDFRKG
jgi:hypothetical protein